jgi:hypothetical protein
MTAMAERKYTISKLNWAKLNSKWAAQRPSAADEKAKAQQQNRDLFDSVNAWLIKYGGKITSLQYARPIRLELVRGSSLAASLTAMGFDPVFVESVSRFGPIAPEPVLWWGQRASPTEGFRAVDVFELRLPK